MKFIFSLLLFCSFLGATPFISGGGGSTDISALTEGGACTDDHFIRWDDGAGVFQCEAAPGSAGGNAWSDAVDSDIVPTGADGTYDVGTSTDRFAQGHFDELYSGFFSPSTGTAADAGTYRLVNNTSVCWRNAGDSGNVCFSVDTNDEFWFNGAALTSTELGYIAGLTSSAQTQISSKVTAVSSTDNAIVRFDSTGGAVQDSGVTIDDNDSISAPGQIVSPADTESGSGTTHTIDWDDGNTAILDLNDFSGTVTLTLSNAQSGGYYCIKIIQQASAKTITWPSSSPNTLWPGGTECTLSTGDDDEDLVCMLYDGTNYLATCQNDYQ